MEFKVGEIYTLVTDLPTWNVSNVDCVDDWSPFSYIENDIVVFRAGTQFEKIEDSIYERINNEVAFKIVHEDLYELSFDITDELLKAFKEA